MKLPHYIITTKIYWKVNPLWQKMVFQYHKLRNQSKENLKGRINKGSIFLQFIWAVAGGIICFLLAISLLEYIERSFIDNPLGETGYIQKQIIRSFHSRTDKDLDADIYKDFASILATLAGIYFATVSIVISTSYSSLSRDTRSLIWAEKLNNFYFTFLVSLIGALLILATTNAYSYSTGSLIFFATTLCSIIAILWFMRVSIQLFDFFDQTVLLERQVIPDIVKLIKNATVTGFQWNVPAVQNNYQQRVRYRLDVYENIIESSFKIYNNDVKIDKGQIKKLLAQTLSLLRYYGFNKPSILAESYWFKRINKQPEWFTSSPSVTDMGLHTGGSLQPEQVPDHMWLEKELIAIVVKIIKAAHASKDYLLIINLYNSLQLYIECFVKEYSADTAKMLLDSLKHQKQEFITDIKLKERDYDDIEKDLALPIAVVDSFCLAPIAIIIGYRKSAEDFKAEKFSTMLSSIKWGADDGIYTQRFPQEVGDQLRYIQKGLKFEIDVEGKRLSPEWYIMQLGGIGALRYLCSIPEKIIALIQSEYVLLTSKLIEQKSYLVALQVIERGLEACSKCEAHFDYYEYILKDLDKTQQVQDIPKPNVDWNKVREQLEECREKLIESLAEISPTTASIPQHPSLPDYFGKVYWVLSQECLNCIISNKNELFKSLFPMYFMHVFTVYNRFQQKYQGTKDEFWAIQNMDIVCDLLALSGYALIYGELGNKELWETAKHTWEVYILALKKQNQNTDAWLHTIARTISVRTSFFKISKRNIVQSSWEASVSHDLTRKGILSDERSSNFSSRSNRTENHSSPIVECVSRSSYMGMWHHKPEDIFVAIYMLPILPDDLKKDIDRKISRLAQEIAKISAENKSVESQEEAEDEI